MNNATRPIRGLVQFAAALTFALIAGSLLIIAIPARGEVQQPFQFPDQGEVMEATPAAGDQAIGSTSPIVEIVLNEMSFEPADIAIPANQTVTLHLENRGSLLHDFSSATLRISPDVRPGDTVEFEMSAPPGVYEIFCSIPGHRAAGMVATIRVELTDSFADTRVESSPTGSPVVSRPESFPDSAH